MKNIPTEKMLIEAGIGHTEYGNPPETYFSVKEVKLKFPDVKVSAKNVMPMAIGDGLVPSVKAIDIEAMTDFDKSIMQTVKNPPKK